jgi:putative ABC transport system permease protein
MQNIFGVPANQLLITLAIIAGLIIVMVAYSAWRYPLPFRLGVRNLPRRKSQTALIVVGLALSTMIIAGALGIGDTIDYSVKAAVYDNLGPIDLTLAGSEARAQTTVGFGGPPPDRSGGAGVVWFDGMVAAQVAALVDGSRMDGAVAIAEEGVPVVNDRSGLSEAVARVRGVGLPTGSGFVLPEGWGLLSADTVLINSALAESLDARIGDELLLIKGRPTPVTVAGIVPSGGLAGSAPTVIRSLTDAQAFFGQPDQITAVLLSGAGGPTDGVRQSDAIATLLAPVAGDDLVVNALKADQLQVASDSAEFITTLFVTFGSFSIFSGLLLIFLIFSVLAAERRSELGMGRAVGLQRSDLVRQFVSEGLAYNVPAATVGALLGVVATFILARLIGFLATDSNLTITPTISLRSAAIAFLMGLVITFVTVTISAVRISRVNIIAAIRDLNLPALPRESQWVLFLRPFTVWRSAALKAGSGNGREALKLFLLAGPKAVLNFWGGLTARGPVLLVLGWLLAWVGVNQAGQIGVYSFGVSLFWIGLGQLAVWIGLPQRPVWSLVGVTVVLWWALPVRATGGLAALDSNPGDFFISGIFLVGGAILIFLYNADMLLNLFAGALGRFGRLLPVARVSIAWPVANKGRTATTLAMFSLIIFTLVGTATITNTFSNFLDPISGSGNYDVIVQANPFNPLAQAELEEALARISADSDLIPFPTAIAALSSAPLRARSPNMSDAAGYLLNGADDAFFASQQLQIGSIANNYPDAAAVWEAVRRDSSLVLIDDFSIDRAGDPTAQLDTESFSVTSIRVGTTTFEPLELALTGLNGQERTVTVIGVISSAPGFVGVLMNAEGSAELGAVTPNRILLRLPEGSDARATANALKSELRTFGVQTSLPKAELEAGRATIRSIFYLIQGFIGLGLLIGIAALGVVTIRAVVERRQQIGVLRAIGFSQGMVQNVFLFEGVFVSLLATLIGYSLALTFAWNLYNEVAADQGLAFLPPWPALTAIGVGIVLASLLTAWLPARATSRVVIAEALRYE